MRVTRVVRGVRLGPLLFIEDVIDRLDLLGLIEIDVVLVIAVDAVAVIDRSAPGGAGLGVTVAAEGEMMAAKEPGEGGFSVGLAEEHSAAALEGAAGVPFAVASKAFIGFVVCQNCF